MKGKIRANTVDRYLYPIRLQIVELVKSDSTVIEFGCGNGDLLFKLSSKIQLGIGVDKSRELITYAKNKIDCEQVGNLEFKLMDLSEKNPLKTTTDYSIASLLFHVLKWENAVELLEVMINNSKTTLICGFSKPENFKQKLLLWLDQRFTKHYHHFKEYENNGFIEGLLNSINNIEYSKIDTFDSVIKIYKITKTT